MNAQLTSDDRTELVELSARYAFFVDTFDVEPLVELFLPDAVMDETNAGLGRHEGREQIRAYFAEDLFPKLTGMMHLTGNHILHATGSHTATGTVSNLFEGDLVGGSTLHGTCWYDDAYVRTPSGWRFASRVVNPFTQLQADGLVGPSANEGCPPAAATEDG